MQIIQNINIIHKIMKIVTLLSHLKIIYLTMDIY